MAFLRGFGKYLPERIVTNAEMAAHLDITPEWIREMSGIEERRFARADETVAEMGVAAGVEALDRSRVAPHELGLILVSSGSAERRFPGPASEVQHRLGATQAIAIDVPIASAGALFALAQAEQWAGRVGKILVVASEKMSSIAMTPPLEKGTAMLFGDGAGACVVDRDQGRARILDFELGTDGSNAGELRLEFGAPLHMNGRSVIMHASRKVPAAINAVLTRAGLTAVDLCTILIHQANANLIAKIAQTLGVEVTKFYTNIARYGNTSSASMLIAAREWDRGFAPGDKVVFAAFGAGYQWGAMLVEGV